MGNKGKTLTLKQRKWLKIYLETGNATEAAKQAYACRTDESAASMGYETLRKLQIPVTEMMDRMGISEARLMKVLDEGLAADKIELAKFRGEIGDERAYPDFPTRGAYLERALKLRGLLRDRLSLEDPEGKPLGPVILPIKAGDEHKFTAGADSD